MCAVPRDKLEGIAKKFDSNAGLEIVVGDSDVLFKSGSYAAKLMNHCLEYSPQDIEENFRISEIPETATAVLNLAALCDAFDKVEDSMPDAGGKYTFACGLLESTGEQVRLVGTDGWTVTIASFDASVEPFRCPIPKGALLALRQLTGESVRISESESHFFFQTETETLVVLKVSDTFPPYEKVFPQAAPATEMTVDSALLASAIERLLPLADGDTPLVDWSISENKPLLISARARAQEEVEASVTGAMAEMTFNAVYLLRCLKQATGDLVIKIVAPNTIVDFQNGPDYRFLVMPTATVQAAKQPESEEVPAELFLPDLKQGDEVVMKNWDGSFHIRPFGTVEALNSKYIWLANPGRNPTQFFRQANPNTQIFISHIATDADREQLAGWEERLAASLAAQQEKARLAQEKEKEIERERAALREKVSGIVGGLPSKLYARAYPSGTQVQFNCTLSSLEELQQIVEALKPAPPFVEGPMFAFLDEEQGTDITSAETLVR